jgi:hypothetical protein
VRRAARRRATAEEDDMRIAKFAAWAVAGSAGAAFGQVTPVGPFTGDRQEGLEGLNNPCPPCFHECLPSRVFQQTADLCAYDGPNPGSMSVPGGWSFFCQIGPHSGQILAGSAGGVAEYKFDTPAGAFGGYFGTNCGTADATAEFFDEGGVMFATAPMTVPADCTWTWNGWESTVAIKRIRIVGNAFGGAFIMMDDLEYSEFDSACYPDCDTSTGVGVLDIFDFLCFQNRFASGSPYACDCDTSTGGGVCDIFDFLCFQNEFSNGCP